MLSLNQIVAWFPLSITLHLSLAPFPWLLLLSMSTHFLPNACLAFLSLIFHSSAMLNRNWKVQRTALLNYVGKHVGFRPGSVRPAVVAPGSCKFVYLSCSSSPCSNLFNLNKSSSSSPPPSNARASCFVMSSSQKRHPISFS